MRRLLHRSTPPRNLAKSASLLGLPPELRNAIYEYVVHDSGVTVVIRPIHTNAYDLKTADLALSCRQLWKEYTSVYKAEALKHATRVVVRLTNFKAIGLKECLQDTQQHWPADVPRKLVFKIWIDNNFDANMHHFRALCHQFADPENLEFEVSLNERTFDFEYCHRYHIARLLISGPRPTVLAIIAALQAAMAREALPAGGRKRRRKTVGSSRNAKKNRL